MPAKAQSNGSEAPPSTNTDANEPTELRPECTAGQYAGYDGPENATTEDEYPQSADPKTSFCNDERKSRSNATITSNAATGPAAQITDGSRAYRDKRSATAAAVLAL